MTDTTHADQIESMLRSHTEQLLESIWGHDDLITDGDGDYPFRTETAAAWVSIVGSPDPAVKVYACAAHDVPRSVKLLVEVSELNARSRWAKVSWVAGRIVVDAAVHWTALDQSSLERALDAVASVADDIGTMIAAVFGGQTPFSSPVALESGEDAA